LSLLWEAGWCRQMADKRMGIFMGYTNIPLTIGELLRFIFRQMIVWYFGCVERWILDMPSSPALNFSLRKSVDNCLLYIYSLYDICNLMSFSWSVSTVRSCLMVWVLLYWCTNIHVWKLIRYS
jgi:hypothetical protein